MQKEGLDPNNEKNLESYLMMKYDGHKKMRIGLAA